MHILKQSELDGMPCPDTLIHGECIESMKHIADNSVDAIIADLPYGITACAFDTVIPFVPLWEAYKRVIKPGGAIVLFGCQPFTSALVMSNLQMFKYELIWDKVQTGAPGVAKMRPLPCHENIMVFASAPTTYNPQMSQGKPYTATTSNGGNSHGFGFKGKFYKSINEGTRFPLSIQKQRKERHVKHPTQKPVALIEYLVRTYTNPGDLVLDNCMGSATLPVACIRTGRRFIGIEKDDVYFAASVERVKAALAQQSLAFDAPLV